RAARAEAGARRQVGVVMDLEAVGDAHIGQHAAHGGMLDLGSILDQLDPRINDLGLVLEERRQAAGAGVAIFVRRGGDDRTAMLAEPGRIMGPAAEQGNAEWCAADDHAGRPPITCSAALSDSGVPMSMKAKRPTNASSVPAGAIPNTSRSSEAALPAAISSSS